MPTAERAAAPVAQPAAPGPHDPAWVAYARTLIGVREVAGPGNSPRIMAWIKALGPRLGVDVRDDATPWCGTFASHCISVALPGERLPRVPVRAKSWAEFGVAAPMAAPGVVLVFGRQGGGHVGFYLGEDATHFHVLGGNQGDAVSIARIAKSRCVAMRWPVGVRFAGRPVSLAASAPVTANEA